MSRSISIGSKIAWLLVALIGVLAPAIAEPIDLSGGTAAQTTTLELFTADLAIDGVSNFTHTLGTDTDPTWQVLLPSARKFQEITIVNRTSNRDRLQNIRVYVVNFNGDVNSDFNGGTLVHTSELLNPDDSLNGPDSLTVGLGDAVGNMIRIKRIVQPEDALNNNARTLSINEVTAEGSAQIVSFSTTRPTVTPGDPVKFEWEVSDSLTSLQINNGVGNVLPLTTDGVGSITFGSGPTVDTDYELTAVDANGSSTAALNITVTNEPIIYSYTTASGFIETGSSANLSWEVGGNATSLTLNGADVSGTSGINVSPTTDTEYVLEASNANGTVNSTVVLRPVDAGMPVITEFLASNDEVLLDSDGDPSDWIELHNPGSTSLSVAGFYLTDELDNLTKWLLPDVTIAPGEYLVVFASGKNRFNPGAELHTNFQLSSNGEYLALVKPDGEIVVTEFNPTYPEQSADVSFGYDGSNNKEGYLIIPTPGAANGSTVDGFVKDTDFTLDRGLYDSPIQVGISSATVDAEIRYTLDGTKPTVATGLVYTSPISLSETTVLRAAAYKVGFEPTNVDTHTYIFPADVISDPIMDTDVTQDPTYGPQMNDALSSVPSISLTFQGDPNYEEREVSVEMINFEDGDKQVDAGLSRFGSYNTDFAKRSFRVAFRSKYGPGKLNFQLFGSHDYPSFQPSKKVDTFELRAGNHDMALRGAYLSNRYADDALLDMGQIAPHGRFVNVYLNGEYWGQYHLRERWNGAMFSEYFGGDKEDYEAINTNNSGAQNFSDNYEVFDGSGEFWEEALDLAAGSSPFINVRNHVDIIDEIDFMLLWTSGNSEAEFRAVGSESQGVPYKFYLKDADGYLRNPANARSVLNDGPLDLMTALRNEGDPDYEILVADRIHKHFFNDGALSPAKNIERLQNRVDETQFAILGECARWGYRSVPSFFSYHENLTDSFFLSHTANMIGKFETAGMYPDQDAPVYSQHGGVIATGSGPTISVSDSSLDVYYVFGSADTNPDVFVNSLDPRLPGGAVNTAATVLSFDGVGGTSTPIVQSGATWSYLDDGSDQGTAWFGTGFNASSWNSGPSQLGYGDNDEATEVGFIDTDPGTNGDQVNATTYFRKSGINIADLSAFESFTLNYTFDDGIAIYVNGQEVERENLAANAAYDTYANDASADNQFGSIVLATSLFVEGNNTIAAEIHQRTPTSSDISFDIELLGNTEGSEGSPLVPVTYPGWLLSRSYNPSTGEWSALNEAFFTPEPIPADADNLVISEFSYHPEDPSGSAELAVAVDQDDFEFIEFMNVSNQPVDLEGVSISDGINFTFGANNVLPAGERMVICENRDAFVVRYGSQITTLLYGTDSVGLSNYGGKLSNSGERLLISDASGGVIQDFTYDDALPWPTESDGPGFSLVLISPSSLPDHNVASNWASSTQTGGSPGEESSVGFAGNTDADDDGDGLTAFMEYTLGSSDSVQGDSTIVADIESLMVEGVTDDYLTISFLRNLHSVNAVTIVAQVGDDMSGWTGVPDVVLVSETDNLDGTSTVVYRSALPVGGRLSGKEFIRLRLDQ
ncbi:MAG: lamin tail domain-containing protein [Luteolibacter sp.]